MLKIRSLVSQTTLLETSMRQPSSLLTRQRSISCQIEGHRVLQLHILTRMHLPSLTWTDLRLIMASRVPSLARVLPSRISSTMRRTLAMARWTTTIGIRSSSRSTTQLQMWMRVVTHSPLKAPLPTMASSMLVLILSSSHLVLVGREKHLEATRSVLHHHTSSQMQQLSRSSRRRPSSRSCIVTRVKPVLKS